MKERYRLKFSKEHQMKFIGHLDLLTLFQRSIRKARLPIAYSQGFNPHQLMSFAIPLSLGVSSIGEYVDIDLAQPMEPTAIQQQLNDVFPNGIRILSVRKLAPEEKTAAAVVAAAKYRIVLPANTDLSTAMEALKNSTSIVVEKRTKGGQKLTDIRTDIMEAHFDATTEQLELFLSAGSAKNLKPDLVVAWLFQQANIPYNPLSIRYTRLELYQLQETEFIPLSL